MPEGNFSKFNANRHNHKKEDAEVILEGRRSNSGSRTTATHASDPEKDGCITASTVFRTAPQHSCLRGKARTKVSGVLLLCVDVLTMGGGGGSKKEGKKEIHRFP